MDSSEIFNTARDMQKAHLPPFTSVGTLPTAIPNDDVRLARFSPFHQTIDQLRENFGFSPRRKLLIDGLVEFRQDLGNLGFRLAYQWIGGSFVEQVEQPDDVDVINFGVMPKANETDNRVIVSDNKSLFHKDECKVRYFCDPAYVILSSNPAKIVAQTTYWNGLFSFSHKRQCPKGFLILQ